MPMNEHCQRQVDQLIELITEHAPKVELTEADEFRLMDVENAAGRELPGVLYAWLSRVGRGMEGLTLLDMSFDTIRLMDANGLWGKHKRGFLLVAIADGFNNSDYYYDLSRPSSPEADDFEVVSMSREESHPPKPAERDSAHGYYRASSSLRDFLGYHIFRQIRLVPRGTERDVISSPVPPQELAGWMARFEEAAEKSGFARVGGLEGECQLFDRGDASLALSLDLEKGYRLVNIGADDRREADLLAQRFIDRMGMRLVPSPDQLMF